MTALTPLEVLYDGGRGENVVLPPDLAALYGRLQLPQPSGRPYVIANFVSTLDGIVAFTEPGYGGGAPISGNNEHDLMVMGLLRAAADAVVIGGGTLRSGPAHLWTASHIYPRSPTPIGPCGIVSGKTSPPLNVIITARGEIDPSYRVFQSGEVPVLILTSAEGLDRIRGLDLPPSVQAVAVEDGAG
jgi:riboflavin biosynthesis pyrimidine reductase